MKSWITFILLTSASFITLQLLLAYQSRLIIERLDAIEANHSTCAVPVEDDAVPMREPWPEVL